MQPREQLPFSSLRLNVFPYPSHTVVTATVRSTSGRETWDRRLGSWDLKIPASDYESMGHTEVLATVLRALVDVLCPPEGSPWA